MRKLPPPRRSQTASPPPPQEDEQPHTVNRNVRRQGPWAPVAKTASTVSSPIALPTERSDLGIFMHPGLTDACSISHVMRNIALVMYRKHGIDVTWEHQQNLPPTVSCQSYLGQTEGFRGNPTGPYVRFGWGIDARLMPHGGAQERGRLLVVTSDHGWVRTEKAFDELNQPHVTTLLTLSPQCEEVLVEAGFDRERIARLPLGVDPVIYKPTGPAFLGKVDKWLDDRAPEDGAFTFLCAGYMQPRKGGRETIEAFCRAFDGRRDVALIVKNWVQPGKWGHDETAAYLRIMAQYDAPPIGYLQMMLSEWQMAALLRQADCLVNAHRREGFGLMGLQAMSCGTPILTTDYHGPKQYATKQNCYLLPITGDGPEPVASPHPEDGKFIEWADYDLDVLAGLMQDAAKGKRRKQIISAGEATAAEWTWERSARAVVDIVADRVGFVRPRSRKWTSPNVPCSVVMPVRNGSRVLETCLRTVSKTLPDGAEIIVYDDASEESERLEIQRLCGLYKQCKLIVGTAQAGCFGTRQVLCEQARGAFIVSIDADLDFSETAEDWFEQMKRLWDERGKGIMHPLLTWPVKGNGERLVQSAGGVLLLQDNPPAKHRFAEMPVTTAGVDTPCKVMYGCGAFHFFHSDLLNVIAVDPLYFPANFGDVDFCYEARAAGYPVWYCPEVEVIHNANSWIGSVEAKRTLRADLSGQRFHDRWLDMVREDVATQNETGALP